MKVNPEFEIERLVDLYFQGLHNANVKLLKSVFAKDCVFKAPGIRRDQQTWLDLVESRPVPSKMAAPYDYKILDIDIVGHQAMVKVSCPLHDDHFIDFLGLLCESGEWKIVNKMYALMPVGS